MLILFQILLNAIRIGAQFLSIIDLVLTPGPDVRVVVLSRIAWLVLQHIQSAFIIGHIALSILILVILTEINPRNLVLQAQVVVLLVIETSNYEYFILIK